MILSIPIWRTLRVSDAGPFDGTLLAWNTFNAHGGRQTHHAILLREDEEGASVQEVHTSHFLTLTPDGWASHVKADWRYAFEEHRLHRRGDQLVTRQGRPVYPSTFPTSCPPETFD